MTEKIWLKHYPPGVPGEINPHAYESVADLFEQSCAKFSHKPAISNFGVQLSYSQLEQASRHFAAYLQQVLALKKGDRLAIMLPNLLQYYVTMFAALRIGLIVVNVNPLYTVTELIHQLNDAQVTGIVVMANFADTVAKALPQTQLKHVIVTELGDLFGFFKSHIANFIVRHIKKLVPSYYLPQSIAFKQALNEGRKHNFQKIILQATDVAYLQYTGGTTGIPKAAVLTHANMIANVEQAYHWVISSNLCEGEEIVMVPLPLYHVFSLTVSTLCFLKMGGLAVLITNPKDLDNFIKQLTRIPYTVFIGINTLLNALLHREDFKKLSFQHLKLAVAGGMPLQKTVADEWYRITGKYVLEGYGLTEASPIVTINPTDVNRFTGSIGLPVPSTDVTIRDDAGNDLAIGMEGEICVKGPQVMREYWHNEAETQQVLTADGWLKTGDLGRFDDEGFLYLLDRKKEMILVSGFKVFPSEVEDVIMKIAAVAEVAVTSMPSETTGEAVKAFVVRKAGVQLSEEEIIQHCHESLTRYKVPKLVEFVDSLPKSAVGKVLRRELQQKNNSDQGNVHA